MREYSHKDGHEGSTCDETLGIDEKKCHAGHVVVCNDDGSFILNKCTGKVNPLQEEN